MGGRVLCESHRYQHTCERLDQKRKRKDQRKLLAGKAKMVDDFLQSMSRAAAENDSTPARPVRGAARDELFGLYERAKRLSLRLYNEYEEPTIPGLPEEDWESVKTIYRRATELTGMFASVDGQPLDLRNPWDPPPPQQEDGGGDV